jgi:hypothetical protein
MNISNNKNGGITLASIDYIPEELYNGSNGQGIVIQIQPDSVATDLTIGFNSNLKFDGTEIYWGDGLVTKLPMSGTISHTYKITNLTIPPVFSIYIKKCTNFQSTSVASTGAKIFANSNHNAFIKKIYLGHAIKLSENIFTNLTGLVELHNIPMDTMLLCADSTSLRAITFAPQVKIIKDNFCPGVVNTSYIMNFNNSLSTISFIGDNAFRYWKSSNLINLNLYCLNYIGENALANYSIETLFLGQKKIEIESGAFATINKCLYNGSSAEWINLVSGAGKSSLTNKVYYHFEEDPGDNIKGWHYVKGVPTIW